MAKKKSKKQQQKKKKQGAGTPRPQKQDVKPAVEEQAPVQEQAVAVQEPAQSAAPEQAHAQETPAAEQAEKAASVQAPEETFTVTLPKPPEKGPTYSAALFLRLLPADKEKLQARAAKAGMSLASYCRAVLESVARRDD